MAERNTMSMGVYTKCVFISSTHAIFDVTIRNGTEVIAEGNVVLDTTLNGDYDFRICQQSENEVNSLIQLAVAKCQTRALKIFSKK